MKKIKVSIKAKSGISAPMGAVKSAPSSGGSSKSSVSKEQYEGYRLSQKGTKASDSTAHLPAARTAYDKARQMKSGGAVKKANAGGKIGKCKNGCK